MTQMTQLEKQQARRRRLLINRAVQGGCAAAVLAALILLQLVLRVFTPDRAYSEAENRMLAQAPRMTLTTISDGSFFSGLSDWFSDQFVGRDGWITLNLHAGRLIGQREINGVYLCADGYLMEVPEQPDEAALSQTTGAIGHFAAEHPDVQVSLALIPNATCVLAGKLPPDAPVTDQRAQISRIYASLPGVNCISVTDELRLHRAEEIYYRTDHHWTSLGARIAFEAMAPMLGIDEPVQSYAVYPVSDSFEGTLASKSGSHDRQDVIEVYIAQPEVRYAVTYTDTQKTVCSVYDSSKLEQKDKYGVFFGGNHARVDIQTTADTGRTLLLFKDSYANCFVQFLLPYYDRIIMLDPRYYYDDLASVLRRENVSEVLMLYNVNTFCQDRALSVVLQSAAEGE